MDNVIVQWCKVQFSPSGCGYRSWQGGKEGRGGSRRQKHNIASPVESQQIKHKVSKETNSLIALCFLSASAQFKCGLRRNIFSHQQVLTRTDFLPHWIIGSQFYHDRLIGWGHLIHRSVKQKLKHSLILSLLISISPFYLLQRNKGPAVSQTCSVYTVHQAQKDDDLCIIY